MSSYQLYWYLAAVIITFAVGEMITVTCSDYSMSRDLKKVFFCPSDLVKAASETAKWPANPVTLDSSNCIGYSELLNIDVHGKVNASTGGEHANCLAESLAKTTKIFQNIGMNPFISGLTLSSWASHYGQFAPWLESGEVVVDRQQCEEALLEHGKDVHNILELINGTLPAEFRLVPQANITPDSVVGCGLQSFSLVYDTKKASCSSTFSLLSSAIKYPERCKCGKDSVGELEMACLDAIPDRCIPTSQIYPLSRTMLSDKHSVLIPARPYSMSSLSFDHFMKQLKCLQPLPNGVYDGWSAVWVPQMSTVEKWFKATMAVLLVTHVGFFTYLRLKRKQSPVGGEENKYIE